MKLRRRKGYRRRQRCFGTRSQCLTPAPRTSSQTSGPSTLSCTVRICGGHMHVGVLVAWPRADAILTCGLSRAGTLQEPQWRGEMAKQYPFTLDPFQSTAIACLVRQEAPACFS